ncbi:MAG: response regulator [Candidatus Ozemobacteraceae bacterium]
MEKKILLVDDSTFSRMMMKEIIKKNLPDWDIFQAGTGEEAMKLIDEHSFGLMLLDFNMPDINGIDLGKQIRKKQPAAKIALVTANQQNAVKSRAEDQDFFYIPKPLSEEKLRQFASLEMKPAV